MFMTDLCDRGAFHFDNQCVGEPNQQIGRGSAVANKLVAAQNLAMMYCRIDDAKRRCRLTHYRIARGGAQEVPGCPLEFIA